MPNYLHSIGIDVCKAHLDAFNPLTNKVICFQNNEEGMEKCLEWLRSFNNPVVIIEPTGGYELALQSKLLVNSICVAKVNASRIRSFARSAGYLGKTDAIDAKVLSLYGQKLEPYILTMTTEEQLELANLVARRRQLVDMTIAEKNRLEKTKHTTSVVSIKNLLTYLKNELNGIDKSISVLIANSKDLRPAFDVLTSIKGIGETSGAILLAELPEMGHITGKQISSLVGVAPFSRDSGTMEGQRHIYGGRHTVRCALYLVALTAIRCDSNIKAYYQSLKQKGKPSKVAIVACMRKIIVIANAKVRDAYQLNA